MQPWRSVRSGPDWAFHPPSVTHPAPSGRDHHYARYPTNLHVPRSVPTVGVSAGYAATSRHRGVCGAEWAASPRWARTEEHSPLHTHMEPHGPGRCPPRTSGRGGFGVHIGGLLLRCRWSPQHAGGDILGLMGGYVRFHPRNICGSIPSERRIPLGPSSRIALSGPPWGAFRLSCL